MSRALSFLAVVFSVLFLGCQPYENSTNEKSKPVAKSQPVAESQPVVEAEPAVGANESGLPVAELTGSTQSNPNPTPKRKTSPEPQPQASGDTTRTTDWPQFRGPAMQASNPHAVVPIKWSEDQGVLWKTEVIKDVKSRGASSPIVVGDRLFLTAFSGCGTTPEDREKIADLQHHLICLDKHTGKPIWKRTIQGSYANKRLSEHALAHGYASSTPIVDGDRLFTFFGISGVFAFDLDGNFLWQTDVGSRHYDFGSSASLNTYEDLLLVNASVESQTLYALNQSTGLAVWKHENVIRSWCPPVVGKTATGQPELVINTEGSVRGLDPRTGKELWRCDGIEDYVVSTPIIVDDVCYLSGGQEPQLMAIKLGGRGDVTETHKIWQIRAGSNVSSPIFHNDSLYIVSNNGIMKCVDAKTGKERYRQRMGVPKQILASPTILGDHMFLPSQYKGVVVLSLLDQCKIVSRNAMADSDDVAMQASIAESENRLFFRTDNFVYCVGKPDEMTQTSGMPGPTSQDEIIVPKPKHDIDEKTGRLKTFTRCLVNGEKEILDFMLIPYKSVITPEQTTKSTEYILANHQQFIDLRKKYLALKWEHMTGDKPENEFLVEVAELEKQTMQHNYKVRKFIKDMFSEEQMDQHLRENGIIVKKPK